MPYKYNQTRRHHIPKSESHGINWSAYNRGLKQRGNLALWLSPDVIKHWYEAERIYDGTGTPNLYSDMAIFVVHEIRQVFKLPLRQCEGFVNSLFAMMKIDLSCPSFSTLSKRLKHLKLTRPYYRIHGNKKDVRAIAIDSSGLKCYGQDEWHQAHYALNSKKSWRKLHIVVDNDNMIQTCELTDSHTQDTSVVDKLIKPVSENFRHITADAAYDDNPTYHKLTNQFPSADIVIAPQKNARDDRKNEFYRNRNIRERTCYGCMGWQKLRNYGWRNRSELSIQRYKRILGERLHAREFERQKQEAIIGCSVLNKMMLMTIGEIRQVA